MTQDQKILCGCGHGIPTHGKLHELSVGTCCRRLATGDEIPTNFRVDNGMEVCDVNGHTITVYTLKNQRLYAKHRDTGLWTRLKSDESTISIGEEW